MRQKPSDMVSDAEKTSWAVREALAPLMLLSADLYNDAVGYVLMGGTPEALVRVRASRTQEIDNLFRHPGRLYGDWPSDNAVRQVAAAYEGWGFEPDGISARGYIYATADLATVVRLGRLLAEIGEVESVPGVPGWFYVLVFDGAMQAVPRERPSRSSGVPKIEPVVGVVDRMIPAFLERVAIEGGVANGEVVRTLLMALLTRPAHLPSWHSHPREILCGHQAFTEYFSRHSTELVAVTEELTSAGRERLLICIGPHATDDRLGEVVAALAVDTSKSVRTSALDHLAVLDEAAQGRLLKPQLIAVPISRIKDAVTRLVGTDSGIAVLNDVLVSIQSGKAQARHKVRSQFLEHAVEQARQLRGRLTMEGTADLLAGIPVYEPLPDPVVEPGWVLAVRRLLDQKIAEKKLSFDIAVQKFGEDSPSYLLVASRQKLEQLRSFTDEDFAAVLRFATGTLPITDNARRRYGDIARWVLKNERTLFSAPGAMLLIRIFALQSAEDQERNLYDLEPCLTDVTDLRQLRDAIEQSGIDNADQMTCDLILGVPKWSPYAKPGSVILPYLAERPEVLDPYFSWKKSWGNGVEDVLRLLEDLPTVPSPLLSRLVALALGTDAAYRRKAQLILEHHAAARSVAENALADSAAEVRVIAAVWLKLIADPDSVPILRTALKEERRENVRSALLSALKILGDDISIDLTPRMLLAEAIQGLSGKESVKLDWFPFDQLPEVRWEATGEVVPRDVIRWWVTLATKLKSPSGEGLIDLYIGQLDVTSRQVLGSFVLQAWINQDTHGPSAKSSSEHQVGYAGSAKRERGLLALTIGMSGTELVRTAREYFTVHKTRRIQAEYLVQALAAHGSHKAVQQVLAMSLRFKYANVQGKAQELVQEIADRNGWDQETFMDRMVQTAGFDDDGILRLNLGAPDGGRVVTGRISPALGLQLRDPEGVTIKELPERRESDSEEVYKEAKQQLKETLSELRNVANKQKKRLVEGMITERNWTFVNWREFILKHPLMLRFGNRLVWFAKLPGDDQTFVTFRPDTHGTLLRADNTEITLSDDAQVSLVHAAALESDDQTLIPAWRSHFTTHKVKPLFDQGLGPNTIILPVFPDHVTAIEVRKGWLSDWFTIRDRAKKFGYSRFDAWPDSTFFAYSKTYKSLDVTVEIEFTGAYIPPFPAISEENNPAAVTRLGFYQGYKRIALPVKDVPKALLAVSYQEYLAIAEGGAFDPDWAEKSTLPHS